MMSQKNNIRLTSWSDEDLLRLCEPGTHRIWYDGFEYKWQQNLSGVWTDQCPLKEFDNYAHAYSFLVYNLASWKKEYDYRIQKKRRKDLTKIRRNARMANKVAQIISSQASSKDKVIQLVKIIPDTEDISELLRISKRTIKRYIKTSKN